jgi:hypothetical protein
MKTTLINKVNSLLSLDCNIYKSINSESTTSTFILHYKCKNKFEYEIIQAYLEYKSDKPLSRILTKYCQNGLLSRRELFFNISQISIIELLSGLDENYNFADWIFAKADSIYSRYIIIYPEFGEKFEIDDIPESMLPPAEAFIDDIPESMLPPAEAFIDDTYL